MANVKSKKRKTNNCMVTVRAPHDCCCCGDTINTGERAKTINPLDYHKGRKWICLNCLKTMAEISSLRSQINRLPFDDEGGAMALNDYAATHFEDFIDNCKDSSILHWAHDKLDPHNDWYLDPF